ncbi:MAG: hypothetical protein DRG78_15170 [Epsilonproteobacteria bacterium]|nr:MAG: hypothetical protein DRG78_15170 [Campylobacterota bacterium]
MSTTHMLTGTIQQSLKAARSSFSNEETVALLVKTQVKELKLTREKYPDLSRNEAIKIALLNSAFKLSSNDKSETVCLAKVKKQKATPQFDWLKLRNNFILELCNKDASYREIKDAIYYRFHYEISHVTIAKFIKIHRLYLPGMELVMDTEKKSLYINRERLFELDVDIYEFKFTLETMSSNFNHKAEHTIYPRINPVYHEINGHKKTAYDQNYINFKIVEKELVRSLRISYNKNERDYIYIQEVPLKIFIRMFNEFTKEIGLKFSTRTDLSEVEHFIRKDEG